MEYKLKSISPEGIPQAIAKVELYRFLNEPEEAESICLDLLTADPENQMALRLLGLAITDQFSGGLCDRHAEVESTFQKLKDPYERHYYTGVLHERRAKAQLRAGCSPHALWVLFDHAMRCFEEAEKLRPKGNDEAILRWNRCIRLLQSRKESEWHSTSAPLEHGDSPPL